MRTSRKQVPTKLAKHQQASSQLVTLAPNSRLSQATIEGLEDLFDFIPPQKLSRKLRTIFLSYMHRETEMLPSDISETIMEFELLLEFLDTASDEAAILTLQKD